MPFNGSGVFTRIYNWVNDAAANIKIRADRMDAEMDGFATGLSNCVTRDGQSPATANLPMGGFKHLNVALATNRSDYATYGQLQDSAGQYVSTVGGTATAITLTPTPAITAYATGQTFTFRSISAATGAATVNVSGLGAKTLLDESGAAIAENDWVSGAVVTIVYDGTRFLLKSRNGGSSTLTNLIITNSTGDSLFVTNTGAGNCFYFEDSSGDTTPFLMDSNGRIVKNHTAVIGNASGTSELALHGTSATNNGYGMYQWTAAAGGSFFWMSKSRGTGPADYTIVQDGDSLGLIRFQGANGTGWTEAGRFGFEVDGTPGAADMPGRFVVLTTPDGATTPTEGLRVDNAGNVLATKGCIGYRTGAGGTVTQATSKATAVTLHKQCGQITMNAAALAANTVVSFTFNNNFIAAGDIVDVMVQSGAASATSYTAAAYGTTAGACTIWLRNMTAGSLSEAVVLSFNVRKSVTA